jgi:hypothetical protein
MLSNVSTILICKMIPCNAAILKRPLAVPIIAMALLLASEPSIVKAEETIRKEQIESGINIGRLIMALVVCPHLPIEDRELRLYMKKLVAMGISPHDPVPKKIAEEEVERIQKAKKEGDATAIAEVCRSVKRLLEYLEQ